MINSKLSYSNPYYHELRSSLVSLTRGKPSKVLEIGCAAGQTLAYYKSVCHASEVIGVEISHDVATLARSRPEIDNIIVGNIEVMEPEWPFDYFDLIVVGHVLEHLVDPWKTVQKLTKYLKPGGQLIGAVPNLRHYSVSVPLVFLGRWQYQQTGIMDWTHLRFFTKQTVIELLASADLIVDIVIPDFWGPKSRFLNRLTLNLLYPFWAYAYNFSASKSATQQA